MSHPNLELFGPFEPSHSDIPEMNELFSESFTERYRRDGMTGVRVPKLDSPIWRYAIASAGCGAMVWRNSADAIVAFNVVHNAGSEGWMGPLAVGSKVQGRGIGTEIVRAGVDYLETLGATTIGLETMPRTVDNIGFYSRIGFHPVHLTLTMVGRSAPSRDPAPHLILGDLDDDERTRLIEECARVTTANGGGSDFSTEMRLTHEMELGDTVVLESDDKVRGFALYHSAPLVEDRPSDELRLLKLYAEDDRAFAQLLTLLEAVGADLGFRSVAIRCQGRFVDAYRSLIDRGYRVRWTDLRMVLSGCEEPITAEQTVLFSNWEI